MYTGKTTYTGTPLKGEPLTGQEETIRLLKMIFTELQSIREALEKREKPRKILRGFR